MADHATPNLPARDFDAAEAFYAALGFSTGWKDGGWMILRRGRVQLEFFPYPDLDPATSSFSCCLRLDDLDSMVAACRAAGIEEKTVGWPRLHGPRREASGLTIAYLVDPDGTLLRLIQND
ncbi:bleomycin resistance protein [Parerythrobacter aurantius]|uniref:bleomycin resistance protein n=1 Tax=Parerythrobacter aurantius TaxID=3127706 RepID=UPI00324F194A